MAKTKLEQQIEILELNASKFKADRDGKYSSSYYALIGKIKNLKKNLPKTNSWNEYLSK